MHGSADRSGERATTVRDARTELVAHLVDHLGARCNTDADFYERALAAVADGDESATRASIVEGAAEWLAGQYVGDVALRRAVLDHRPTVASNLDGADRTDALAALQESPPGRRAAASAPEWARALDAWLDRTRERLETVYPPLAAGGTGLRGRTSLATVPPACRVLTDLSESLAAHDPLPSDVDRLPAGQHEQSIPEAARAEWGQVYTPPSVARFLARWAIREPSDAVLDPACGTGRFLMAAYDRHADLQARPHPDLLDRLSGVEYNDLPATLARRALLWRDPTAPADRIDVTVGDFFDETPTEAFDAVLMNPPYTRPEGMDDEYLASIRDAVLSAEGTPSSLSKDSGFYGYFLFRASEHLADGGRMAVVLPNAAFDADYGTTIERFLGDRFAIEAVLGSLTERTIRTADVNTLVVLLRRVDDAAQRANTAVRFVGLDRSFDRLETDVGHDALFRAVNGGAAPDGVQVRSVRQGDLLEAEAGLPALFRHKWNPYLRLSERGAETLARHASDLQRMRDVGTVSYGWKPGAVYFYVIPRPGTGGRYLSTEYDPDTGGLVVTNHDEEFDGPDEYTIERECWMEPCDTGTTGGSESEGAATDGCQYDDGETLWRPRHVLKSTSSLSTRTVDRTCADHVLVSASVPRGELSETYPGFAAHVRWGEARGFHERQSVDGRSPWYSVDDPTPGALVLTQFHDERLFHPVNVDGVRLTNTFQQFETDDHLAPVVAGYANSTLGALWTELFGRTNLGSGALTAYGGDFEALPIPALDGVDDDLSERFDAALRDLAIRPVGSVLDELDRGDVSLAAIPESRRRLDRLVFEDLLSLSEREQLTVYRELRRLVAQRVRKGQG